MYYIFVSLYICVITCLNYVLLSLCAVVDRVSVICFQGCAHKEDSFLPRKDVLAKLLVNSRVESAVQSYNLKKEKKKKRKRKNNNSYHFLESCASSLEASL